MDETRQLYIISGCNGAGKTTASYTVLPEILLCKEFVNADEIAKGLSPFNPESMAIDNVPMDVIYRRYQAGINNLFQIYMPRVDYWLLADNSISPRVIVAEGYQHGEDRIYELELFKCIKNYVK